MRKTNLEELNKQFDRVALKHMVGEGKKGPAGATIAVLHKGDHRYVGISACSSKDQFNRRIGRKIALGRALHLFKLSTGLIKGRDVDPRTAFKFNVLSGSARAEELVPAHLYKPKKLSAPESAVSEANQGAALG